MQTTSWLPLIDGMLMAIDKIGHYTRDLEQGQFMDDEKTAEAVFYNLQVLAESSRQLPEEVRERFGHIPWDELAGIRAVFMREREDETMDILWPFFKEELTLLHGLIRGVAQVNQP